MHVCRQRTSRYPDDRCRSGDVIDDHSIRTDLDSVADAHLSDHFRPGSHPYSVPDMGTVEVTGPQTDGGPGKDNHIASHVGDAIDDHLTVGQVQARGDDHRISDAHLGGDHCADVTQARDHRHGSPHGENTHPVEQLREEGVAGQG